MGIERLSDEEIESAAKSLFDGDRLWWKVKRNKKTGRVWRYWAFIYTSLERTRCDPHSDPNQRRKEGKPASYKRREICLGTDTQYARDEAAKYRIWLRDHKDPVTERAKLDLNRPGYTIMDAIRKHDERKVSHQSKEYKEANRRWLKLFGKRIGPFHPSLCTGPFLLKNLKPETITGGSITGFWSQLRAILECAQFDCGEPSNPIAVIASVKRQMPPTKHVVVSHGTKALPRDRLAEFMLAVKADKDDRGRDDLPERTISSYLVEFFLVTGIRIDEVLTKAKWGAMDEASGIWDVPQTKNGLARAVVITPTMARVLKDVRRITKEYGFSDGENDPVFLNFATKKAYTRGAVNTRLAKICDANNITPRQTTHMFRTNLEGWGGAFMAKYGYKHYENLVEIQLGHKLPGKTAQAYSAQDDDFDERRKMMETYDKFWNTPYADFIETYNILRNSTS